MCGVSSIKIWHFPKAWFTPAPSTTSRGMDDIYMDFISGLLVSMRKKFIFVVVDRLNKYAHLIPLKYPFTVVEVAQAYLDHVFKLHGWPRSIVSDMDSVFLSQFWKGLFSLHET